VATGKTGIGAGLAVVLSAALLMAPSPASAAERSPTTLKLRDFASGWIEGWGVSGSLRSKDPSCLRGRTVRLTRGGETVDRSETRGSGRFALRIDTPSFPVGRYTATVKRAPRCASDSALMAVFRVPISVTIDFDDELDRFFGTASSADPGCLAYAVWALFAGTDPSPFASAALFNREWSYDYGGDPPANTYRVVIERPPLSLISVVANRGNLSVSDCAPRGSAELTLP
jgi:hypothetical protein